uniref:StAR-related lipid transfer protein 13 n=1 Tax=Esox lucius TaxID=8010 RepID=A0A3P8ZL03_ESOLU
METTLIVTLEEQKCLAMSTSTDRAFTPQSPQLTRTHHFTSNSGPGANNHSPLKSNVDGCLTGTLSLELLELELNPQDRLQHNREVDGYSNIPIAPGMKRVLSLTPDVSLPESLEPEPVQIFCPLDPFNEPDRGSSPSSNDTNNNGLDLQNTSQVSTEDTCPASNIMAPMNMENEILTPMIEGDDKPTESANCNVRLFCQLPDIMPQYTYLNMKETGLELDVGDRQTETCLELEVGDRQTETCLELEVGDRQTETCLELEVGDRQTETCLELEVGDRQTETGLEMEVGDRQTETCLELKVGDRQTETCLELEVGDRQTETGLEMEVGDRQTETNWEHTEDNTVQCQAPTENEYIPPLLVQSGADVCHITNPIAHSTITFSDYTFIPSTCNSSTEHSFDCSDSFSEENEEGDDEDEDVFPEQTQSRESLVIWKGLSSRRVVRNGCMSLRSLAPANSAPNTTVSSHHSSFSSPNSQNHGSYKAEINNMESPWCESMSRLMKKLDQLNLDIEEALSTSSSPSDTPCATRKHQCGAVSGVAVNQSVKEEDNTFLHRGGLDTGEWPRQDQDKIALHSSTIATGTGTEKTVMCSKITQPGSELEAKEACDWLRAAGFPQYAQLFEDSQFPIDISPVKKDHDFLDKDLVEPLCRRLNTLNKCASMKLDVNLPKKKTEDSDEEDLFAISDRWTFEWTSRRWSRLKGQAPCHREGLGEGRGLRTTTSSESVLTDLSEPEISSLHSESSEGSVHQAAEDSDCSTRTYSDSPAMPEPESTSLTLPCLTEQPPHYGSLPAKNSHSGRTRAKDFLRRMETLRSRGTLGRGRNKTLVISAPVLQTEPQALKTLHCVGITNGGRSGAVEVPPEGLTLTPAPQCPSSSEGSHSSGSAVSSPTIKERKASHERTERLDTKRSGMYLEDLVLFSSLPRNRGMAEHNQCNEFRSYEDLVVHIPKDHKPGTFPKALSIESLSPVMTAPVRWQGSGTLKPHPNRLSSPMQSHHHPAPRGGPRGSRMSVYDNVPGSHLYASTGDLMDLEKEDLFPHLDDILQHVNGLQQIVDHWSQNLLPPGGLEEGRGRWRDGQEIQPAGLQSSSQITLDFEGMSVLEGQSTASDRDRDGVSLNETEGTGLRERRDSGVGASLTRPNRLRWPSFQMSNRLSHSVASLQITNQSAGQLSLLQKFSLLRLTAIMEKYSMSNKHGWTWSVPKFIKRMKVPDYKDKNVFGVPLLVHVQRSGQPLPLSLQQALRYLRSQCLDQVGLFRKSGVKSRIQALRQMNESSPDNVSYEDQSAYDVADMVKQFFRDLPEPLLTSKLGETFLHIYQYVPKDQRLQALQAAIMLMSDENREVLQTLLCFLSDVTSSVEENQMTPMNIAVCLAPSLFHLNILKKDNLSPKAMQRKYATGRPDQKDLNENLAATQGLAHMIIECNRLFEIPHEMVTQSRNSYIEADLHAPTLEELSRQQEEEDGAYPMEAGAYQTQTGGGRPQNLYQTHMERRLQELLKEAREKAKGWVSCASSDSTELHCKKAGDGNPLRRWRVAVEVEAPPSVVLNRVLRERHLWDVDLLQWKVVETLDKHTEMFHYVLNRMPPHPSRDFLVLRSWRTDLPKGTCALMCVSVEHEDCPPVVGVRAVVLESNYLLEPCGSGKSRLTHICRVDLKGRSPEWYNKAFGHLCAAEAARIRNSFQPISTEGPETKI